MRRYSKVERRKFRIGGSLSWATSGAVKNLRQGDAWAAQPIVLRQTQSEIPSRGEPITQMRRALKTLREALQEPEKQRPNRGRSEKKSGLIKERGIEQDEFAGA